MALRARKVSGAFEKRAPERYSLWHTEITPSVRIQVNKNMSQGRFVPVWDDFFKFLLNECSGHIVRKRERCAVVMKGKIFDTTNTLLQIRRIWAGYAYNRHPKWPTLYFWFEVYSSCWSPLYAVIIQNVRRKLDSSGLTISSSRHDHRLLAVPILPAKLYRPHKFLASHLTIPMSW